MDSGGGSINKYLHKKFKKQTSIEPPTAVENHVHQQPFRHSTNTPLQSSISSELSERPETAYTFVNYSRHHDRQEPPGATALVARKLSGATCSEQSDEDISNHAKIKRSPKEPTHLFRTSSINQDSKVNRLVDDVVCKEDISTSRTFETNNVVTITASNNGKYVCPFCNLACSKPSVLQKHIRAHTNERPYPCQSCNFSFKTRSNLYKHCRSRTHVNRVNGNKGQDIDTHSTTPPPMQADRPSVIADMPVANNTDESPMKTKPYKPRFHTKSLYYNENEENSQPVSHEKQFESSDAINEHGGKNMWVPKGEVLDQRIPPVEGHTLVYTHSANNSVSIDPVKTTNDDQPLNLTKNRKRCLSEVSTEPAKKSLIKELLLQNLYANNNLQCEHCKMIFKTFTELELHRMKTCKGRSGGPRYSRSSSVNVASILTQNKNAFDNIPQIASMFPLKSPGPFLGKTRLVESDKTKSFSCDDDIRGSISNHFISSYDLFCDKIRKPSVKLYGGEVKVTPSGNQNDIDDTYPQSESTDKSDYHKLSENRVIRNTLQSGGIVVQHEKQNSVSKSSEKVENRSVNGCNGEYSDIMDFSQNAAKSFAPNLKELNLTIPGIPTPTKFIETSQPSLLALSQNKSSPKPIANGEMMNPMNLLVNGKVIRHVPGIPGPVNAETIKQKPTIQITHSVDEVNKVTPPSVKVETPSPPTTSSNVKVETFEPPSVPTDTAPRKFARPNSLALKPSSASLKHHHGLTPTMFNQILISPDTPRGDKKYNEQFLHGNYFSYLGLKCSTRSVYCTLNKTQPFYVPHFKKLSMYSEWRQQDHKTDKLYASNYNSWQRNGSFAIAGKYKADIVVDSNYKFIPDEVNNKKEDATNVPSKTILGGYESHEDYTYVRGRDESSTRNQEHEAAYGLLSLSQKINSSKELQSPSPSETTNCSFINDEQLVHVSKSNYAKNKILDQISLSPLKLVGSTTDSISKETNSIVQQVRESRPLTYPYSSTQNTASEEAPQSIASEAITNDQSPERNIVHFNVIKRYNPQSKPAPVVAKPKEHFQPAPKQISPSLEHTAVQQKIVLNERKRKLSEGLHSNYKVVINDSEAMDLSVTEKINNAIEYNDKVVHKHAHNNNNRILNNDEKGPIDHYVIQTSKNLVQNLIKLREYDNSAMETLADIATKQEKLEKNSVAKNVATEFLKLATKNENLKTEEKSFGVPTSVVAKSDLIVKSEENKNCTICNKTFNKPSQLRLHMNIHYLERPYRCESCSVSFRTKGHLQKHERSAGHHNKLSSSPALSSLEPRPFKCIDCSIAFRIHGHLAKHLRSKMHILKLECLSKIPFGLYAELERSNSLLTEINTADGDQCLDSLKTLARRIFINDPSKLNQLNETKPIEYLGSDTTVS